MARRKFDAKAKAKRQKIILAVLGVVFLAVLAWQVPSVLKMMNKKPVAAATTPPPAAVAPVPGTPVTPVPGNSRRRHSGPAGELADSDPARSGRRADSSSRSTASRARTRSSSRQWRPRRLRPRPPLSRSPTRRPRPVAAQDRSSRRRRPRLRPPLLRSPSTARPETVSVGGTFPQTDPVFVLVSVTKTSAKVAISGGSLDSGGALTLKKGKKVTLENTVDGARYVLLLVSTR